MDKNSILSILFIVLVVVSGYFFLKPKEDCEAGALESCSLNEKDHEYEVADYEIYPGDLAKKLQAGEKVVLLDVRTPEEYAEERLAGAILVPLQELSAGALNNAGISKDQDIYIYCRSGNRSKQAYDLMTAMGYENIKSVNGGLVHWQEDSNPFLEGGDVVVEPGSTIEKTNSEVGPNISFNQSEFDFGEIKKSEGIVRTEFIVSNNGDEILKIGELSSSCGCTSGKISETEIKPGESAILTVSFDPNFHKEPQGQITRTVFIPSNDLDNPEAEVRIKVEILEN